MSFLWLLLLLLTPIHEVKCICLLLVLRLRWLLLRRLIVGILKKIETRLLFWFILITFIKRMTHSLLWMTTTRVTTVWLLLLLYDRLRRRWHFLFVKKVKGCCFGLIIIFPLSNLFISLLLLLLVHKVKTTMWLLLLRWRFLRQILFLRLIFA